MGSGASIRLVCGAPGVHKPSGRPPGPAAGRSPGSPPSACLQPACPRPRRAPGSCRHPSGGSLGCRASSGRCGQPVPTPIPSLTPSPSHLPTLFPFSTPAVSPRGAGRTLLASPSVQSCRLPCACLAAARSTEPSALARAIQGLVWGAKALLRACPFTCEEEEEERDGRWKPTGEPKGSHKHFAKGDTEARSVPAPLPGARGTHHAGQPPPGGHVHHLHGDLLPAAALRLPRAGAQVRAADDVGVVHQLPILGGLLPAQPRPGLSPALILGVPGLGWGGSGWGRVISGTHLTCVKTSRAAPPHCPDCSARSSAPSSTMPPRAQFTTCTPRRHLAKVLSFSSPVG